MAINFANLSAQHPELGFISTVLNLGAVIIFSHHVDDNLPCKLLCNELLFILRIEVDSPRLGTHPPFDSDHSEASHYRYDHNFLFECQRSRCLKGGNQGFRYLFQCALPFVSRRR